MILIAVKYSSFYDVSLLFATVPYWRDLGVILSTADKGKPTQNPYAEEFFSIVRRFCLNYSEILTITDAKKSIIDFFNLYNQKCLHGAINNMSPNQKLESYRCGLKWPCQILSVFSC